MGLLGSESSGNRLDALLENARGTSVTETRLTILQDEKPDGSAADERPPVVPGGKNAVTVADVMESGVPEAVR